MQLKKAYLILAFAVVSTIALLYGISPVWFASTFLGMTDLSLNFSHILRAVMCLYLALGCFWLFSAFSDDPPGHRHSDDDLVRGWTRDWPRRELHRRWSARTTVDDLCRDGIRTRADRLLDLHASGVTLGRAMASLAMV